MVEEIVKLRGSFHFNWRQKHNYRNDYRSCRPAAPELAVAKHYSNGTIHSLESHSRLQTIMCGRSPATAARCEARLRALQLEAAKCG